MDNRESIKKTKAGFEESFRLDEFYNKQTRDEKHLEQILNSVPVEQGMKFLIWEQARDISRFRLPKNTASQKLSAWISWKKRSRKTAKKPTGAGFAI